MVTDELKELEALLEILRRQGVRSFKNDEIEVELGALPLPPATNQTTQPPTNTSGSVATEAPVDDPLFDAVR